MGLRGVVLAAVVVAALGAVGCKKEACTSARKAYQQALLDVRALGDPATSAAVEKELASRPAPGDEELKTMFEAYRLSLREGAAVPQNVLDRKAAFEKACH